MNNNEYLINIENEIIENFQDEVLNCNIKLKGKHPFSNHIYTFAHEYVERHLTYRSEQIKAIVELSLYDNWHKMNHPNSTLDVAFEGILEALLKSGRVYCEANYKIETYKLFPNI